MTHWRRIGTVATFEFFQAVKRPGYLIATFGMPLFLAAYAGIVAVPAYFAMRADKEPAVHGVVDAAGLLHLERDERSARRPVPEEVGRKVPQIKTHRFVYTADRILIVDPKDNRVADVIELKD